MNVPIRFRELGIVRILLETDMRFAGIARVVSGVFEDPSHDRKAISVDADPVVVLDARFVRIPAGKRGCPGRLTDRIRTIGTRKTHAVGRQTVDVRRVDILVPDDATHRVRKPMIGHDDEDVRSACLVIPLCRLGLQLKRK